MVILPHWWIATDLNPVIHLSKWPKMVFFGIFRVFLVKNFLAAPPALQKCLKLSNFCPKVGHLSQCPKMVFFGIFRVFLAKNFLAAPSAPQNCSKWVSFCPKVGHFSNFSAPSAPKNGSFIDFSFQKYGFFPFSIPTETLCDGPLEDPPRNSQRPLRIAYS